MLHQGPNAELTQDGGLNATASVHGVALLTADTADLAIIDDLVTLQPLS
jgi:hypothetical protein